MFRRYRADESFECVGGHLGFSAGMVQNHLLALGVTCVTFRAASEDGVQAEISMGPYVCRHHLRQ